MQAIVGVSLLGAILAASCVPRDGAQNARDTTAAKDMRPPAEPEAVPWNFVSAAEDNELFRRELERLAVLPVALEYTSGSGFRLNDSVAQELLVLTPNGIEVVHRRQADASRKQTAFEREQAYFDVPYPDEPPLDVTLGLREHPATPMLVFTTRSGLQLGSIERCEVPTEVARRDSPPETPGTHTSATCFQLPSHRFFVAIRKGRDVDNREAWLTITAYDATWRILGRSGRSPAKWPDGARPRGSEFSLVGVFEASGLYSPVFATLGACASFELNTFLSNGHLAQTTIPFPAPDGMVVLGCGT